MLLSPRWFLPLSLIVKHVRILLFTYDVPFSGHTIAYAHLCACFKQSKRPNACPSLKKASLYWNLKQCMEGAICPVCVKIAYSTCWEMAVVKLEPQLYHEGKHKVSSEATIFFLPIECCQIQPHSNTSSDEHPSALLLPHKWATTNCTAENPVCCTQGSKRLAVELPVMRAFTSLGLLMEPHL